MFDKAYFDQKVLDLQEAPPPPVLSFGYIIKEDGYALLKEDGYAILLEGVEGIVKMINETLSLYEAEARRGRVSRLAPESIVLTEIPIRRQLSSRLVSEVESILDSAYRHGLLSPLVSSEVEEISETSPLIKGFTRISSEVLSIAESFVKVQ